MNLLSLPYTLIPAAQYDRKYLFKAGALFHAKPEKDTRKELMGHFRLSSSLCTNLTRFDCGVRRIHLVQLQPEPIVEYFSIDSVFINNSTPTQLELKGFNFFCSGKLENTPVSIWNKLIQLIAKTAAKFLGNDNQAEVIFSLTSIMWSINGKVQIT